MDKEMKTHKRKNKTPEVDPGDLVSEKSIQKDYKIIGKVINKGWSSKNVNEDLYLYL